MYITGNPLYYTDPSGYLSDEQINEWVVSEANDDIKTLEDLITKYPELYKALRLMRFGDKFHLSNSSGLFQYELSLSGQRLRIGGYSAYELAQQLSTPSDWAISRNVPGMGTALVYSTVSGWDSGLPQAPELSFESQICIQCYS